LTSLTVDRLFIDHTTIEHTSRALLARSCVKCMNRTLTTTTFLKWYFSHLDFAS